MKENKNINDEIRTRWEKLQSKEDILGLLNYVGPHIYGPLFKPFAINQLNYFGNPAWSKMRYSSFVLPKKSGKGRLIHSPSIGFKYILSCFNFIFQTVYPVHHRAFGFVPGKNIADNALLHTGKPYVYNIDLSDFFHSFDLQQVKLGLMFAENGLGKVNEKLAYFIAALCTHPFTIKGTQRITLPQGAPTSPTITNILCFRLDRRLHGLAKRFNLVYSRYADDITFSGGEKGYLKEDFQTELLRLLKQEGLKINPCKTRSQARYFRQEVTGLTVNEKVNISRKFHKKVSSYLYLWKRYGYEKAHDYYVLDNKIDKPYNHTNIELVRVLEGKLNFIRMIKGVENSSYQKLRLKFEKLRDTKQPTKDNASNLETVVDAILLGDIDRGLELFKQTES